MKDHLRILFLGCLAVAMVMPLSHAQLTDLSPAGDAPALRDQPRAYLQQQLGRIDGDLDLLKAIEITDPDHASEVQASVRLRMIARQLLVAGMGRVDAGSHHAAMLGSTLTASLVQFDALFQDISALSRTVAADAAADDAAKLRAGRTAPMLGRFIAGSTAGRGGSSSAAAIEFDTQSAQHVRSRLASLLGPLAAIATYAGMPSKHGWIASAGAPPAEIMPTREQIADVALQFRLKLAGQPGHRNILAILDALDSAVQLPDLQPRVPEMFRVTRDATDMLITLSMHDDLYLRSRKLIHASMEQSLSEMMNSRRQADGVTALGTLTSHLPTIHRINELHAAVANTLAMESLLLAAISESADRATRRAGEAMGGWVAQVTAAMAEYRRMDRPASGPDREIFEAARRRCGDAELAVIGVAEAIATRRIPIDSPQALAARINMQRRVDELRRLMRLELRLERIRGILPGQAEAVESAVGAMRTAIVAAQPDHAIASLVEFDQQAERFLELPGEASLRQAVAAGVSFDLLPEGRAVALLATIDASRSAWAGEWAAGRPASAVQAMPSLARLCRVLRDADALAGAVKDSTFNRWAAMQVEPATLTQAYAVIAGRIADAVDAALAGRFVEVETLLDRMEQEVPDSLLLAWTAFQCRLSQDHLYAGIPGTLGKLFYGPPPGAFMGQHATELAMLSVRLNEVTAARVGDDSARLRELRSQCAAIAASIMKAGGYYVDSGTVRP